MDASATDLSDRLIDEYQESLTNIIGNMTAECSLRDLPNLQDPEETKNSMEQAAHQFTECYQKLERFFTRQSLMFAACHPEEPLMEELVEMRADLDRKTSLLARHKARLFHWQKLLRPDFTADLMAECQKREKPAEVEASSDGAIETDKLSSAGTPKPTGETLSETQVKQEISDMDTTESQKGTA